MTNPDPVDQIDGLIDTSDVSKVEMSAELKAVLRRFESVDEVANTSLSGRFAIVLGGFIWIKNTESVEAANGTTIIEDGDGVNWYKTFANGLDYVGAYNAGTTYQESQWVTYNNSSWFSIDDDNVGHTPALGSAYWAPMAVAGSPGGPITIPYTFSTTTTDSDPGNGGLRLGSATQNATTVIRADLLDNLGNTWTGVLDTFDGSTSTIKGFIRIQHEFDETKWLLFTLSARATPSGYRNLTVACVGYSAASPFANGNPILLEFIRNGDKGDTGATGATGSTGSTGSTGATGPAAWSAPAAWLTATAYVAGPPASVVTQGGETYVCLIAHTSGTFATDLAASKWLKVAAKGDTGATGATGATGSTGATGAAGSGSLTICRVVAVANVAIATALENGDTLDGVTLTTGDRVLLTAQTAPEENGVYTVPASGASSRDSSFTTYDTMPGVFLSVMEGTVNADTLWRVTSNRGGTINVTAVAISAFSASGGGSADGFGRARCVATTNVALSNGLENGDSVGGVTLATGDSVLLTGQTAPAENGLYTAVASGAASRHTSFSTFNSLAGSFFSVSEGTKADKLYQCTSDAGGTINTTALAFQEFPNTAEAWGNWTGVVGVTDNWGAWT